MQNQLTDEIKNIRSLNDLMTVLNYYNVNYDTRKGGGALCPFHSEVTPSFKVNEKNGTAYFKCFGCKSKGDIITFIQKIENLDKVRATKKAYEILGRPCNLEPNSEVTKIEKFEEFLKTCNNGQPQELTQGENIYQFEKMHVYTDEEGKPLFSKNRYKAKDPGAEKKKTFTTRALIETEHSYKFDSLNNARKVIYNLPAVKSAIEQGHNIFIVEGEKDCETLKKLGYVATTIYTKKWHDEYTEQLKDSKIIFSTDTGEAGEEFKQLIFNSLKDVCKTFKCLELPGLAQMGNNKDVTDWLEQFDDDKEKIQMLNNVIKETDFMPLIEFGKYKYNGLYTYYLKSLKDDEFEVKKIYDGLLKIEYSHTDIDSKEEKLILSSKMFGRTSEMGIKKGLLSKGSYAETINNQKGFLIEPKCSNSVQDYIYTQYKHLTFNDELKEKMTTNKIGWTKYNNMITFVYPRYDISLDNVIYHNEDTRFNNIFNHKGDFKTYTDNVLLPLLDTDIGVISVSATLGSLLLEILNIHESFILDIYGKNGRGKTILLYALASMFGHPNRYTQEWNSTKTAIISNASELNNFPLMLDDTKKCDDKTIIAEIIYSLSGGKDRARANQDGTSKEQKVFKNVTLSTGETSLLNYIQGESAGAGAFGRVISIDTDDYNIFDSKEQADKIADSCKKVYGVFGIEFCKWLYEQSRDDENINLWLETYTTYKDINYAKVSHHTSTRKANHIALLQVTYDLLLDFLKYKQIDIEVNDKVFNDLLQVSEDLSVEQDIYLNAYESIIEYLHTISHRIHTNNSHGSETPGNCVGWFKDDIYYIIDRELIANHLNKHGDFNDILKEWKKREYIKTDTNKLQKTSRTPYKIDSKSKSLKTYAIDTRYYNVVNDEKVSNIQNSFELIESEYVF